MKLSAVLPLLVAGVAIALPAGPLLPRAPVPRFYEVSKRASNPLNTLLAMIAKLFPINVAVKDLTSLISIAEQGLALALDIDTTENGLAKSSSSSAGCADVTIIFARGTTEAGNVGAIVGPEFFDAVKSKLGGDATLAVQGVDYPADIPGFLAGGSAQGSQTMANDVSQALQRCPNTKLVMSGYSQGGQLVHNAAKILPADTMAKVSSVVIFGDPNNGQAVAGVAAPKTLVVCHAGDNICQHGDLILLPHLTYAENADQAANFVIMNIGAISS